MSWVSDLYTFLWAGSRCARGKLTVRGIANGLNYCVICIVYTQFTNVVAGSGLETHAKCWDQAGPCF